MANSKSRKKGLRRNINNKEGSTKDIIIMLLVLAVLTVLIFNLQGIKFKKFYNITTQKPEKPEFLLPKFPPFFSAGNATLVSMNVPAVDKEGKGVPTTLVVEAMPGSGRVLVDIDNLLFWADTQHSIRVARNVAQNISGTNASNYDLIYNIYANATAIGGPSAGAALTIATVAALQNKSLKADVMITGSVNHDGSIGPVERIFPKAEAAKAVNVTMLLVPLLQSRDVIYETREHCEKFGPAEVCTTEQVPKRINISEKTGVTVIEVGTIQDAMKYFFAE